jgi:DNA polymerase-3 subunit alpha
LEHQVIKDLLKERAENGKYSGLNDFVSRVKISLEQLIILIRAGAFRFTGKSKKELLWDAHFLLGHSKKTAPEKTLFDTRPKEFKLPELWKHDLENTFDEIELLGFSLGSPFELLETEIPFRLTASHLPQFNGKTIEIVGYLVHRKPTQTNKGQLMHFGTWLDLEGQWLDTVHFPDVNQKSPFSGPGCYAIRGKVTEEYGFYSIEVQWMQRLKYKNLDSIK